MDKKLKLIFLSLVLVLLFMPMASALFGRCRTDADCKHEYRCIKSPGKEVGKCTLESAIRAAGFGRESEFVTPWFEDFKYYGGAAIGWIFGYEVSFTWVLLYIIVFLMLAFAFRDVFAISTAFSEKTQWVLGGGLAAIVALTGVLNKVVILMFGLVAIYGAFVISFAMVVLFTIFFVLHIWLWRAFRKVKTQQMMSKAEGAAAKVAAGGKLMAEVWKQLKKP